MLTKSDNVVIVSPAPNDITAFKYLRLEALKNDPQAYGRSYEVEVVYPDEYWQEKFQKTLEPNPQEHFLFAKLDNEYVGMIGAYPKNNDEWILKAVYVKPEFRGKGIGTKLIETMLNVLSEQGVVRVELMVNTVQGAAVRMYERSGFCIVDTAKDQKMGDGKVYDEYIMQRVLTH